MDTVLFNNICISASILNMGIPLQYHALAEHIMKTNIENHNTQNAIDELSFRFPMMGIFEISKYDKDDLIIHNGLNVYYFYTKGNDIINIIDTDNKVSNIIYDFLSDKNNDIEIKKLIIKELVVGLFEIDAEIIEYKEDGTFNIKYNNNFIDYLYNLKILDKGYYSLTIIERNEKQYGTAEICGEVF